MVPIPRKRAESNKRPERHRWVVAQTLVRLAQMPLAREHARPLRLPRLSAHRLQDPHLVLIVMPKDGLDRLLGMSG